VEEAAPRAQEKSRDFYAPFGCSVMFRNPVDFTQPSGECRIPHAP
jgi:hypothetical protein